MRICLVDRHFLSAHTNVETYTYNLARALAMKGHRVHIVCERGNVRVYPLEFFDYVRVHQIPFTPEVSDFTLKVDKFFPWFLYLFSKAMVRMVNEIWNFFGLDVVEVPESELQGYFTVTQRNIPAVVRLHGDFSFLHIDNDFKIQPPRDFRSKMVLGMTKKMLLAADGMSAPSQSYAQLVKEIYRIKDKNIEVVYNGVDLKSFKTADLEKRDPTILFTGSLNKRRGIDVLAHAIPVILRKFPNAKFTFAGRDSLHESGQGMWGQYIRQNLPKENILFLKEIPMDQLVENYQRNSIAVFPALYEPSGMAALEAMACGCAVVASTGGSYPELVEHGKDALLARAGDPESLAENIVKLLEDQALRQRIAQNGINKVKEKFNPEHLIEQDLRIYEKAIAAFEELKKPKPASV